jgi:hypothetical protein
MLVGQGFPLFFIWCQFFRLLPAKTCHLARWVEFLRLLRRCGETYGAKMRAKSDFTPYPPFSGSYNGMSEVVAGMPAHATAISWLPCVIAAAASASGQLQKLAGSIF